MRLNFVLAVCLCGTLTVSARTIKGTIKDAQTGEEIIGASVIVKEEPTRGVVTGLDGSFSLGIDRKQFTLVCSYVGYKTF